jgi:hypothetical protein
VEMSLSLAEPTYYKNEERRERSGLGLSYSTRHLESSPSSPPLTHLPCTLGSIPSTPQQPQHDQVSMGIDQ